MAIPSNRNLLRKMAHNPEDQDRSHENESEKLKKNHFTDVKYQNHPSIINILQYLCKVVHSSVTECKYSTYRSPWHFNLISFQPHSQKDKERDVKQ